jgi:hypothetical protein
MSLSAVRMSMSMRALRSTPALRPRLALSLSLTQFQSQSLLPSRALSTSVPAHPISLERYIQEVRPELKPPVANRMIYNEQLQVMVVGGPNQRKVSE